MGKSSINGPFSMAMLNNQRVYIDINIYIYTHIFYQPTYHFACSNLGSFKSPPSPTKERPCKAKPPADDFSMVSFH